KTTPCKVEFLLRLHAFWCQNTSNLFLMHSWPRPLARPIMRGGTRLHPDQTRCKSREKRQHLAAPKLLPHHDLLIGVNAVNLKHVLGDIQTDRGNLHLGGSPHVIRQRQSPYGTAMPGAGASRAAKKVGARPDIQPRPR